jgi:hypothetical protein
MAYYTKQQVSDYIKDVLQRAKNSEIRVMVNLEECARKLGDEEDLLPMFWVEMQSIESSGNMNVKMEGSVFVKIEFDLYCDDRYAIDCYQATKEGVPVYEIVKKRNEETASVRSISEEEKAEVANKLKDSLKTNQCYYGEFYVSLADYFTFITFDSLLFPASTNRLTLYINSTDLLSSKTKAEVEIIGTSTTPPKNRDLIYNIFKNSVYKETDIDSWLQNWHSDPSVSSSPNYPQNYNDFLSQTNAAGVKVPFKISSLKNFILTDYVVNKYNSDPSKVESLTTLAWSPAVYNAYKEIWDNSFLSKVTAANPLTYITKPGIIKAQDSLWLSNNVPLTKIEFIFKFPKSTIPVLYNGSISANGFFVSQKSFQDNGVDVTEKTFAVPSKNGDALNPMRIGFYNYFQNNTSALDLSLYLSATPVVTSIVNIAP